jgi:hypothetical protein
MSEFIAVGGVKKLENVPQPEIGGLADTRADAKLRGVEVDLPEDVVELTPWGSDETHVHDCVGVPEKIHACGTSGACV